MDLNFGWKLFNPLQVVDFVEDRIIPHVFLQGKPTARRRGMTPLLQDMNSANKQ